MLCVSRWQRSIGGNATTKASKVNLPLLSRLQPDLLLRRSCWCWLWERGGGRAACRLPEAHPPRDFITASPSLKSHKNTGVEDFTNQDDTFPDILEFTKWIVFFHSLPVSIKTGDVER